MGAQLTGAPYGLECSACPRGRLCESYPSADSPYPLEGQILPPKGWADWGGRCPVAWLFNGEVALALELEALAKVTPLAGWPAQYPAWVPMALREIDDCRRASKA